MTQRLQSEAGFSLIELLVAMVILGIGAVSVMAAIGTAVLSSGVHRNYATAETVTRDFTEAINTKANTAPIYNPCPTAAQLTPTYTPPKNKAGTLDLYTITIEAPPSSPVNWALDSSDAVQYWLPDTTFPNGTFRNRTACTTYAANLCAGETSVTARCDPGLQRVWVHVTTNPAVAGGKAVDTVDQYSRILVRRYDAAAA